jgi:ribosomal protein S18 acetylase RimI-like enzyme
MMATDVGAVAHVSDSVHGRYTERADVYAERRALYPAGCFLFERAGQVAGYLICHPWRRDRPVPLDAMLGAIPADSDCFYLHDLALLPTARGSGAGKSGTALAVAGARAGGFDEIRLVAVGGAESFWATQGFEAMAGHAPDSYGEGARAMRRALIG